MYLPTSPLGTAITTPSNAPAWAEATVPSIPQLVVSTGDSQLQRWSSLIGIITAIVGNVLISFALNIQRYAHIRLHKERSERREKARNAAKALQRGYGTTREDGPNGNQTIEENGHDDEEPDDPLQQSFHSTDSQSTAYSDSGQKPDSSYLQSPYWWGGIVLMAIGEAGNFLAYGFAPASIVSPLGVVALISNCVIAPIMLKEHFRLRDFWGVVIAVAGAVTVVLSAKQQERKLGPHEIWGAITTTEFEVYMAITIILTGGLMSASPKYGRRTILIDLGLVGLFGGYTALSTKGVASMLSSTLWRAFTTPVTYALLAVLIGTALMQVKYINRALQRFDSTQVIPVQFVMFTLSVIIGSAILYRDFEKATAHSMTKFVGGCLLTFFGVYLITSGRPRNVNGEDEESSDEEREERISLIDQDPTREDTRYTDEAGKDMPIRRASKAPQNDDSDYDDDAQDRRRSSHISFIDPLHRPRTPRVHSSPSYQPSVRITTSDHTPEQSLGAAEVPLLSNPWQSPTDEPLRAVRHPSLQGLHRTTSSTLPPTEAHTSFIDPSKPPTARSVTQGNIDTHPDLQQAPVLLQAERPLTPAKNTISRIMPGPLVSPLSGGLSAVVADSLRRGVDPPLRNRSLRRPRFPVERSKSVSQRYTDGSDEAIDALGASPSKNGDTADTLSKSLEPESFTWSTMTRARTLSNTLSGLLWGGQQRTERPGAGDEEAGPSGS